MGEKGMDTSGVSASGMGAQVGTAQGGNESDAQSMGDQLATAVGQPPPAPPPKSSGPDAGEVIGDILDPLGIHKLFG